MNHHRIARCLLPLVAVLFSAAPGPSAHAAPVTSEEQLTAAPWKVQGENLEPGLVRTFRKDGTFTTEPMSNPGAAAPAAFTPERGLWTMTQQSIELQFAGGRKDVLSAPMDTQGIACVAGTGKRQTYVQLNADKSDAPEPELSDAEKTAVTNLLLARQWVVTGGQTVNFSGLMIGPGWSRPRVFKQDGTFTTADDPTEKGTWRIVGHAVFLDFPDFGYHDTIWLPLVPQGSCGTDAHGRPTRVAQSGKQDLLPPPTDASLDAPPANMSEMEKSETLNMLLAGVWKITGGGVGNVPATTKSYRFAKDATFANMETGAAAGKWRVAGRMIVLVFADGHKGALPLPLMPEGTPGSEASAPVMAALTADRPAPPGTLPSAAPVMRATQTGATDATAAATAPEAAPAPVPPDDQKAASDMLAKYNSSLVFVEGKEGAGSGFIASMDGENFLITNAHVATELNDAGFHALDGTAVKVGVPSMAVGHDIFCMSMPAGGKPLEVMKNVESEAAIGDEVVVLGNAEGGGVINTIMGRIVGIGADRLEVDAQFKPGNSGSPIIHIKTGKVIGVATYTLTRVYDSTTHAKLPVPEVRHFGYRIDSVKRWETVNWRTLYAQAAELKKIEELTGDLENFFRDIVQNKGVVHPEMHMNPALHRPIEQWVENRSHQLSPADRLRENESMLLSLKSACQADVMAARRDFTYDYFRRELADQQEIRDAMSKAFGEIVNDLEK